MSYGEKAAYGLLVASGPLRGSQFLGEMKRQCHKVVSNGLQEQTAMRFKCQLDLPLDDLSTLLTSLNHASFMHKMRIDNSIDLLTLLL